MKMLYKILLVFTVIIALFLGFYERTAEEHRQNSNAVSNIQGEFASYKTQRLNISGKTYQMYITDTDELRGQGLSGKSGLPEGSGMMFTFPVAGILPFWMNGMKFPLDILWVREGKVVEIWGNAPVPQGRDIPSYTPKQTADLVLEFPAGFVRANGLKVGVLVQ